MPRPTAAEASAARAAIWQLRESQKSAAGNNDISVNAEQLRAIGILASDAFRPDRLEVGIYGKTVNVSGSHKTLFGRWLNMSVVSSGKSKGFPKAYLTIGPLTLSSGLSRFAFETARTAINLRGAQVPPLDHLVRHVSFKDGVATASLRMPQRSGLLEQLGGKASQDYAQATLKTYCRLTALQASSPSMDGAVQVNRAFVGSTSVETNRAAFVALAMLVVDPRAGELAGLPVEKLKSCQRAPIDPLLRGRADLTKHWSLSAALAATTGVQFSQAVGEWKELADSVSKQSEFAIGDPSGFSFLDIAADRSGFLVAQAAIDPASAQPMAARLTIIGQEKMLPAPLMKLEDGLPNEVFVERYGGVDDPRFQAVVAQIDAELNRSGPLAR